MRPFAVAPIAFLAPAHTCPSRVLASDGRLLPPFSSICLRARYARDVRHKNAGGGLAQGTFPAVTIKDTPRGRQLQAICSGRAKPSRRGTHDSLFNMEDTPHVPNSSMSLDAVFAPVLIHDALFPLARPPRARRARARPGDGHLPALHRGLRRPGRHRRRLRLDVCPASPSRPRPTIG
jgi:hypothetical protein